MWTAVTQDMLARHGVTLDEVEGLIDILRRTTEAEVTCVLKEEPDGTVRVSLRSLGDVDVRRDRRGRTAAAATASPRASVDARHRRRSSRASAPRSDPHASGRTTVRCRRARRRRQAGGLDVARRRRAKLRKVYGQRRVGHAGTLDPDATGVLLVGLGRATRLLRFLQETGQGVPRARSCSASPPSTLDAAGEVLDQRPMPLDARRRSRRAARAFVGDIEQVPPMVSAVKVGGRRLHELAARGRGGRARAAPVHIDRFDVEDVRARRVPGGDVQVECGERHLRPLARRRPRRRARRLRAPRRRCAGSRVGSFTLAEAHPLDAIEADPTPRAARPRDAMRDLERVDVDAEQAPRGRARRGVPGGALAGDAGAGPVRAWSAPTATLLAVYERQRRRRCKPAVVRRRRGGRDA